jgi:hypothetical protein
LLPFLPTVFTEGWIPLLREGPYIVVVPVSLPYDLKYASAVTEAPR